MAVESRRLSDSVAELPVAAPLGGETKKPAVVVIAQGGGGVAPVTEAVQPEGRAGAETLSKFSLKPGTKLPSPKLKVTLPRSLGPSWRCNVAWRLPPHVPCAVKVKVLATAGPMGVRVP